MSETTTETRTLPVNGGGEALGKLEGVDATFALTSITADRGTRVMWTPDLDNSGNTDVWVTGVEGAKPGELPEGIVTLTLTYSGE